MMFDRNRKRFQHWYLVCNLLISAALVLAYATSASADNQPGTDMARLIQAEEKQAVALEKIAAELQDIKRKCK